MESRTVTFDGPFGSHWVRATALATAACAAWFAWGAIRTEAPAPAPSMQAKAPPTPARPTESLQEAWDRLNTTEATRQTIAGNSPARQQPAALPYGAGASQHELNAYYAKLDAQLKPGAPLPEWAAQQRILAKLKKADTVVDASALACSEEVCRIDVAFNSTISQQDLAGRIGATLLAEGGALMYRYGSEPSQGMQVYLQRPASSEAAEQPSAAGGTQ